MMNAADRWEKSNSRTEAIFAEIQIKLKMLLQLYNCSESSSHGVVNSFKEIPASESLNVALPMDDFKVNNSLPVNLPIKEEFLPSTLQIETLSVCAQSELVEEVNSGHEQNLTASMEFSSDFNGGMVDLPEEIRQKRIDMPESFSGSKLDVKTTFVDSFRFEPLIVNSIVERDCCGKKTPLEMDNESKISSVVIDQGVFRHSSHLSDPPDLIPTPPPLPPLAPPWLHEWVCPISLNSPPIESDTHGCFQLDYEVLNETSSHFDFPIARLVDVGTRALDDSMSSPYTYNLFVEMPMQTTFFGNVHLFHDMKTILACLQTSSLHISHLTLGSVPFACNTFESLILCTKNMASLVQNYSAISELNLN